MVPKLYSVFMYTPNREFPRNVRYLTDSNIAYGLGTSVSVINLPQPLPVAIRDSANDYQ